MQLIPWARFSWDLTRLSPVYPALGSPYRIRPAAAADKKAVETVIFSAFTLDADWNFLFRAIREELEAALEGLLNEEANDGRSCLVLTHGSRIIGASVFTARRDAENHLLTGPCILMEYRNRGLATALLGETLSALRDAGLETAHGLTKANSPAAEFVYAKFGAVIDPSRKPQERAAS